MRILGPASERIEPSPWIADKADGKATVDGGGASLVTHTVVFTWVADVSADQVRRLQEALDAMAAELADMAEIRHGPDLRFRDGNGDYALVATFPDRAGWDAYQVHPTHKAFVRDYVTPILASRVAIQF